MKYLYIDLEIRNLVMSTQELCQPKTLCINNDLFSFPENKETLAK